MTDLGQSVCRHPQVGPEGRCLLCGAEPSNSDIIDGWYDAGPDDSVGRADAQESIRRAAEAQMDRWDGKTVEEVRDEWMRRAKERLNQILELEAERDRYRAALEEIAAHFVPHKRKTYGPVDIALDAIRREVEEALAE